MVTIAIPSRWLTPIQQEGESASAESSTLAPQCVYTHTHTSHTPLSLSSTTNLYLAFSNQTLQLRTYENPLQHNKSTNPFDNDSEEDDDYSASSNFDRDRTFSKSSQNSANSLVDSLEPLPPNARASVWASCVLSGSRQVTTVAVVPGDPKR